MQYTKLRQFNSDIHALVIPQGRYYVTPFGLHTVSAAAQALRATVAINGGDYDAFGAVGLAASDGHVYGKQVEWQPWVNFTRSNNPQINAFDSPEPKWNAVAGKRFLVSGGKRWPTNTAPWYERHPRTLIGVTLDAQCILMVADGRTGQSAGVTLFEAAELMMGFEAWRAIDLDGGGSSAMWLGDQIVNTPIDGGVPGRERLVGNQIVVWVDDIPPVVVEPTGETMDKITGKTLVRLNVRDKPGGTVLRTLPVNSSIEADWTDGAWLHLTMVNDNPVTEEWWASDGQGKYIEWRWETVDVPPGGDPPTDEYILHVKDDATRKFIPE